MRFIHNADMRGRFSAISLFIAAAALASVLVITLAQFNTTGAQTGDYDADDDGLIEINSVAQLNAVRWDLNGDGAADRAANVASYRAAFPNAQTRLGCPISGCNGYELTRNLTSGSFTQWTPIGDNNRRFSATFKGNGYTISNLGFNSAADPMGLFGGSSGTISGVGLKNVRVNVSTSAEYVDLGTLVGDNIGTVTDSYATGSISATLGKGSMIGGLLGYNRGNVSSVYSNVSINVRISAASADDPRIYLGGLVGNNRGSITSAYSKGSVRGSGGSSSAVAGLIGTNAGPVTGSYSTSAVSSPSTSTRTGGLIGSGHATASTIRTSYWDTQTSGQTRSVGGGVGYITADLQSPTANSGIYSTWPNARWDFGASNQYPALKVDFNGDGRSTWQEFGSQRSNTPPARPTATSVPTATPTTEPTATLTPTPEPTATHTPSATPETAVDTTPTSGDAPVDPTPTPTSTQVTAAPTPTLTPTQVTRQSDPPASNDIPPAVQQEITRLEGVIATLQGVINDLRANLATTTAAFERRIAALEGSTPAATSTPTPTATATTVPIVRVAEPTATPTTVPTVAATPGSGAPTATPTPDPCIQKMVGIGWLTGSWGSGCASTRNPSAENAPAGTRYARFYTFTLDAPANVTVSLASQTVSNTYLYLLSGAGRNGDALHENDDVDAENGNYGSRIRAQLPAGSYTVEATTYKLTTTGNFTLTVDMGSSP